jgi:DNA-binding transcriptional LysR family regulator
MTVELTDFTVFLEVVQQGSFSRASAALRLSQPSVSTRIAALERSLGTVLFERSTRGIVPTTAARALTPYARRCVSLADEGRQAARSAAGGERLVMAAPASFAETIFPPLLASLASSPLELVCRTAHSHEVVELLVDGAAQLGLLLPASAPDGITVELFFRTPFVCVARPGHPLTTTRPCRLVDLADHRLAVHAWGREADDLEAILRAARVPPTSVSLVSPSATALALAVDHGYVALLPAEAARRQLHSGALVTLKPHGLPKWSVDVAVAYRRREARPGTPVHVALQALRALSAATRGRAGTPSAPQAM